MSKIIEVDSELLLYTLKYATTNTDADSDKVIENIGRKNIDNLDNNELRSFIQVIESEETLEIEGREYSWLDLKEALEKEIYVRESVEKVMSVFRKKIN